MDDVRRVVGDYFENQVSYLFNLIRIDVDNQSFVPDLVSSGSLVYVEVKASAYTNGGVIRESQLKHFGDVFGNNLFYAFAYHSITKNMEALYPTEEKLRGALDLRSLYLLPLDVVKAHFNATPKRKTTHKSDFVQLRESLAKKICDGDAATWKKIGLSYKQFESLHLTDTVCALVEDNTTLDNLRIKHVIRNSFRPSRLGYQNL